MRASLRMGRSADTQAANQPDYDGTDQYQAKNAAKAGPAIPAVTIVAAASEQQNQQERPSMMIQLTVFFPAVIAIYAATGAWVFSCDPISKTVDIVRGGLLYGWIGVLFTCARVLVFPY
jgi:hypothetical protein